MRLSFYTHLTLLLSPIVSPRGLLLFCVVVIVAVVEDSNLWCGVFIFIYSSVYKAKLTQIQLAQQSLSTLRVYVNCVKVTLSRMVFKSWQTISNSYYYFDCKTFEECLAGINTTTVSTVYNNNNNTIIGCAFCCFYGPGFAQASIESNLLRSPFRYNYTCYKTPPPFLFEHVHM